MAAIISPYVAPLNGSGTGFVEHIEHTSVTVTGIEYVFGKQASAALLSSIKVSNTDPAAGDAGLTVEYADADKSGDAFQNALMNDMMAATGGALTTPISFQSNVVSTAPISSQTLDVVLKEQIRTEINNALKDNDVLAYLESDVVGGLTLEMEWSAAASNMRNNLKNNVELKAMFLQLLNRVLPVDADDSAQATPRDLGEFLSTGDALAFVFNANATIAITTNTEAAPQSGNGEYDPLGVAASYSRSYKVGFVFKK
jgi:hypothetical protein